MAKSSLIRNKQEELLQTWSDSVDPTKHPSEQEKVKQIQDAFERFKNFETEMGIEEFAKAKLEQAKQTFEQIKASHDEENEEEKEALSIMEKEIILLEYCCNLMDITDMMQTVEAQQFESMAKIASALAHDDFFAEVEAKYGEKASEKVYQYSVKNQVTPAEALEKIIQEEGLDQITPDVEKHENFEDEIVVEKPTREVLKRES